MQLGKRAVVALSLASCIVAVSACGSSSATTGPAANPTSAANATNAPVATSQAAGPTTAPAAGGGTRQFKATLTVTGAVTKKVDFTQPLTALPPCATLAQAGFSGTWSIPQPNTNDFKLNWNVDGYKGPGTYADASAYDNSVEFDGAGGEEFDQVDASVLSITVNADGSGTATFQNLQDQMMDKSVNGTETWTCS